MEYIYNIIPLPIFTIIIGVLIYLSIKIKTSKNDIRYAKNEILERENNAYFVKKKEVPESLILYINTNLPFKDINITTSNEPSIKRLESEIKNLSDKKLLIPNTQKSNIVLKEEYGHSTLDEIIFYEQNYNKYIIALNSIASILINDNQLNLAEQFLLEAVEKKSDVSKTYIYLIDIYKQSNKKKLETFINEFKENFDKTSYCYKKTVSYFENSRDNVVN